MKLYVGNLPFSVTEESLHQMFATYGQVDSTSVVRDKFSGQPRGFAFVEMGNQAEGEAAIQGLNGSQVDGRAIAVNEARPQAPRPGGGGFGGGRGGDRGRGPRQGDRGGRGGGGGRGRY